MVHTKSPVWIGANDLLEEGRWMWTDGTILAYKNWHKDEPNNFGGREDCGALWNGMKWNDWFCSSKAYYICEKRTSTIEKENKQKELEKEQRRKTAEHFIAKREAALKREVLLKGKMTSEEKAEFETRWAERANLKAKSLVEQKEREQEEAKKEAVLKVAAEKEAKKAHEARVREEQRAEEEKEAEIAADKEAEEAAAAAEAATQEETEARERK